MNGRAPFSVTGVVLALILYVEALRPSLLPRGTLTQVLLGGLVLATGYALGATAGAVTVAVVHRFRRRPLPHPPAWFFSVVVAAALLLVTIVTALRLPWQDDQRAHLGIEGSGPALVPAISGSIALAALAVLAGRGLRRLATRIEPPLRSRALAWAVIAGSLLMVATFALFAVRVLFDLQSSDLGDRAPPTSRLRSGGPGSLVPWESLGDRGRSFVTRGPSPTAIAALGDTSPVEPIRAYVGLESAPTVEERAALLVAELERTGAFDRSAIVLFTPAGPGFVEPAAVDTAEYLLAGDVASAAAQYSTLPSSLSVVLDGDAASETSLAVFEAVREAIDARPREDRPRLFVFGESLGALGSQAPFEGGGTEALASGVDGALWTGPPAASTFRAELMRDATGPEWEPVVEGGRVVRFGAEAERLSSQPGAWGRVRAAYVQHPTDPVVWFDPLLLVRSPAWLEQPRGPGVDDRMRWRPIVTFEQLLLDLAVARDTPEGLGHRYSGDIARAWIEVIQPEDWTGDDTDRLLDAVTGR